MEIDHSSDEDSDISDSDINEYAEKPYKQLKEGTYKVRGLYGTLRCPFCAGKKKQDYKYKDLLQHASGVAKGSANRNAKQKANHLALSKYLQDYLANEVDKSELPLNSKPVVQIEKKDELYVWPWTGILVNIVSEKDGSGFPDSVHWLAKFSKHKPSEVLTFWNGTDLTAEAIIDFGADWNGFMNAAQFEKSFEKDGCSKKNWIDAQKTRLGTNVYGWCAREEDYKTPGLIGDYLRKNGKLRTLSQIEEEKKRTVNNAVAKLVDKIDETNENLSELKYKYNETTGKLRRILDEKDKIHKAFTEESKKMQQTARDNVKRILAEKEKLSADLENKKKKIDAWSKELNKREAQTDQEREKLEEERRKNAMRNSSLELASAEQKKADSNVCRLVEAQKREKEEALRTVLQLEREVYAKQELEREIAEIKVKLDVLKHMENQDDEAVKAKMKAMSEELADKEDDYETSQNLNQTLLMKERETNDELQEARKALVEGLDDLLTGRGDIRIKRMGEIDEKPFINTCKQRFPVGEAEIQATTLCSSWQERLKDSNWHPFKMVQVDGQQHQEIIDENEENLKSLKEKWGDEIYAAVVTALKEINEYNASGGYSIKELWNHKDNRKATLKEVIVYCMKNIKTLKRKRVR